VLVNNRYMYLVAGLMISMIFVVMPATKRAPRDRVPIYDAALFLLTLGLTAYYVYFAEAILDEAWEYTAPDHGLYVSVVLWAVVLEAGRRAGGIAVFLIVALLSLYPTYADVMPEVISGVGQTFLDTAGFHMFSEESLLGIPMQAFAMLRHGPADGAVVAERLGQLDETPGLAKRQDRPLHAEMRQILGTLARLHAELFLVVLHALVKILHTHHDVIDPLMHLLLPRFGGPGIGRSSLPRQKSAHATATAGVPVARTPIDGNRPRL